MALMFFIFQILVCVGAIHASGSGCDAQGAADAIAKSKKFPKVVIQYLVPADRPCREQINTQLKKMGQPLIADNYVYGSGKPFDDFQYCLIKGPSDKLYAEIYNWAFAAPTDEAFFWMGIWFMIDDRQKFLNFYKQKYGKDLITQGASLFAFKEMFTVERKINGAYCDTKKWISDLDKEISSCSNLTLKDPFSPHDIPLTIQFFTQEPYDCINKVAEAWPSSHNSVNMPHYIFFSIMPMDMSAVVLMSGAVSIGKNGPGGIGSTMFFMSKSVPEFIPFFMVGEKIACQLEAAYYAEFIDYMGSPRISHQNLTLNKLLNSVVGSPSIDMMKAILQHNGNCYNPNEH